jgi:hypothetical protein
MPIPENQLETWSHQGAIQSSSGTYKTVKELLEAAGTPYAAKDYSVFLQGSYGNDTNIYAESDVDVVICLNDCFQSDLSDLKPEEKAAWKKVHNDATYTHVNFKNDVLKVLTNQFGDDVEAGPKAIMIESNGNRRKTDVIAAIQYRRYFKFNGINDQNYEEGICFYTSDGSQIGNYPKQHRLNLTKKHQATSSWFKRTVRVMKNLRTKLVDDGLLDAGLAPSYFIEGLLYNVPNDHFHSDYQTCFMNAFNWIDSEADKTALVCANEQYYLLRDGYATCWPIADFEAFFKATRELWNDW